MPLMSTFSPPYRVKGSVISSIVVVAISASWYNKLSFHLLNEVCGMSFLFLLLFRFMIVSNCIVDVSLLWLDDPNCSFQNYANNHLAPWPSCISHSFSSIRRRFGDRYSFFNTWHAVVGFIMLTSVLFSQNNLNSKPRQFRQINKPIIDMCVLIWMHFSWWFQKW